MNKRTRAIAAALIALVAAISYFAYRHWGNRSLEANADLLANLPSDSTAVIYADVAALRTSPFLADFSAWAPNPQADADYAQFVKDTGFNYEHDLDRIAIAVMKHGQESTLFAIADGRFDRKKIAVYATRSGSKENHGGREIFFMPVSGSSRRIAFLFLRDGRIVLTDDANLDSVLGDAAQPDGKSAWKTRFDRLAGSPVFAVIRQDAGAGSALAQEAPGGIQSPQLSALLDQLRWITLAGKPDGDHLRLVAEGECESDDVARQLSDVLNGVAILAQGGLNDPKTRQKLDPATRKAYLDLLQSADISKIDRGETKSVRVILDLTPSFFNAARISPPAVPAPLPPKPSAKTPATKTSPKKH